MLIKLGLVELYVRSMGKALKVTAIATTTADANAYMAKHDEAACIAVIGKVDAGQLILMADKYDPGITIPRGVL